MSAHQSSLTSARASRVYSEAGTELPCLRNPDLPQWKATLGRILFSGMSTAATNASLAALSSRLADLEQVSNKLGAGDMGMLIFMMQLGFLLLEVRDRRHCMPVAHDSLLLIWC